MDRSAISRGKRRHPKERLACAAAVALFVMPFLMGQDDDRTQARLRAMAFEQKGQNVEAEKIWSAIVSVDQRNAEALAHLGLLEARQEHYETAIDFYRRASAINSELPGLQMNLGLALFKVAQFPDAIKSFSFEIKKHPNDARLTILLGMAHYGMKDYLVAIPYLKRGAEGDPKNITLRMTLARSCLWSKQYHCVLDVHREMLALNAESAEADIIAGEALDQMGDGAGAEKELRSALEVNPKESNAHFGLGYLLWTQSKWAEAASEFRLEVENNPGHVQARIYLADSRIRQMDLVHALPDLENLGTSQRSDSLVHRDLGIVYANSGRNDEALQELRIAMELSPQDVESYLQSAKVYKSMGRSDEANAELESARRLPPQAHPSLLEMIDSIETPAP